MRVGYENARESARKNWPFYGIWLLTLLACVQLAACSSGKSASTNTGGGSTALTLSAISPSKIAATGGPITITGTNFTNDVTVTFGGVAAVQVTYQSSTSITAQAPANATAGAVDVTVTSPENGSATLPKALTYGAATTSPITLSAISPTQVAATGGPITITGTNFTSDVAVTFGGAAAIQVTFQSSTSITAVAPASSTAGAVDVTVSSPEGGTATLSKALTYSAAVVGACQTLPCTYQAADPANTLVGGAAVATCAGCPNGVKVGSLGNGADVIINNVYAPTSGNYTLTIVGCEGAGTQNYQVIVDKGTPVIVPLTGSNWFATAPPTSIIVPLQAGSNNTVELGNATDWSPDVVSIEVSAVAANSAVSVSSITPSQVPVTGGMVTVTGTNFTSNTTVSFGGVAAPPISFQSATQFTVLAPASSSIGPVDVAVSSPVNGSATLSKGLSYVEPAACQGATCVYQAWDPANTRVSNASIATCVGCPNGLKVGGLGYGSAVNINNIYAPATGQYTLTIVGCEGAGTQIYQIATNGGTPATVPLFGNSWTVAASPVSTTVTLNAGSTNTIEIGNATNWSPDVVYVVVSPANIISNPPTPQPVVMSSGPTQVTYDLSTGLATFAYNGVNKISNFYSQAYNGVTLYQSTSSLYTRTASTGANGETDITLTPSDGSPTMIQRFTVSDNHFLVQVELDGAGVASNQMSPIIVNQTGAVDLGSYADTRFLQVPFDNDAWVTYNAASSNGLNNTSFEVGAFYDNTSRNGLVVGSVTHDTWKTGVSITGNNNKLDALWAYGGANDPWDSLPHSAVSGAKITSPVVMVGYYSDWRTGMEDYANTNAQFVPMMNWNGPTPMGWNSGSVKSANLSETTVTEAADYFHNSLPTFSNAGIQYIGLDAYGCNCTDAELQTFINHVHSQGQKVGVYWGPWIVWNWVSLTDQLAGGSGYTWNDVIMKDSNGNLLGAVDGAYGIDPTHPGTKAMIAYNMNKYVSMGVDYIKLDFLSHGMLEGGSNNGVHYDPTVQTGTQAYNQGMSYLDQQLGSSIFIDESIAPLFPYQYAHARRVSCDTYGAISETSYEMNSESYGWWLAGRLYNYNDPDEVHLEGFTLNENKSRVTSTAVAGYMLSGDDVTDTVAPPLVQQWLTNSNINAFGGLGLQFRPVEGNTGTSPVNVLVAQSGNTYYLAVFNYNASSAAQQVIDLGRAGLNSSQQYTVTDLWSGATSQATGTLTINLNQAESTIVKLQ